MFNLIPFIHKCESDLISEEIKGKDFFVIFDGTTRLGKALRIALHYVDDGWKINTRLVRLQIVAKSLTGEELARKVISVLSVQYSVGTQQLLAPTKDCASVNVTGPGKTGLMCTPTGFYFLSVHESYTHALPRKTKYLTIDGEVCFHRQLFTNAVKPRGCISQP